MKAIFILPLPPSAWGDGEKGQKMEFIDLIPEGRDNAISREELIRNACLCGFVPESVKDRDRFVRSLISKARRDYVILNKCQGGYYRCGMEDLQDLQRYIRQEEHRAKATFKNITKARALYEDYRTGRIAQG